MAILTKNVITALLSPEPYLVRWSLWLPGGASIKLHKIVRPDDDRCPHDHPWWFLRIILLGGYIEQCGPLNTVVHRKPWRPWALWRLYWCGPTFRYRILSLPRGVSWTLVVAGPRMRHWGFFTRNGWQHWQAFVGAAKAKRVLWCDDGRSLND